MDVDDLHAQNFHTLDAVLAAAHLFPQQKSIPELLRLLKFCSSPLLPFHRIVIMIETPLQEHGRMYSLDAKAISCDCSPVDVGNDGKYRWYRQPQPCIFTKSELSEQFSSIAKTDIFKDASAYLLLPLTVDVPGYYAVCVFMRADTVPFSKKLLSFCSVLRGFLTSTVTQILQREEQKMEVESLRSERDQLNILVAVTNVAMSTLHLEDMLGMVTLDIRRFFSAQDVAIVLLESEKSVSLYCAKRATFTRKPPKNTHIPKESSIYALAGDSETPKILRANQVREYEKKDPLLQFLVAEGNTVFCLVPLVFQKKILGIMLLAHGNADIFTRDAVSLLAQIGQSVACAVKNAREYALVNMTAERLVDENEYLSSEIASQFGDGKIIGQSKAIQRVLYQVSMVASSDSTVLLLGETGTGKEVVAEAIHRASPRKDRRMVKINCAAVPEALLESELFGHEKGAFTGALKQTKGRFELANGSTLMLDEVGDMPLALQPKLLRILQSRELERLGGHTVIPVDVRLVAATNQNLLEMVKKKSFRDDLYYRLNVFPIQLPPLRERKEDIPLLAQYYMQEHAKRMKKNVSYIAAEGMRWLCSQDWPGNVRELANVVERAVILSKGTTLQLDGCERPADSPREPVQADPPQILTKEESHIQAIKHAVKACNGLIAGPRGAAVMLGVNRTTLNSRMKRLGLTVKDILEE